ncbi:MAG: ion transporter [Gemmatimonadota bacterium]|nr:ion transporter [Gemmatimonadota bacterium]
MNRTVDAADAPERANALQQLEEWIERPMQLLGLVWLVLLVVELAHGLSPGLAAVSAAIWVIFIIDFTLRLILAPDRGGYLRRNWLVGLSLFLPALRVLRFFRVMRVLRATRGLRLLRIVTSVNRSMNSLRRALHRRGFGYVTALTVVVMLAGAAGMYAFERDLAGSAGFVDFTASLWWTAMVMTTLGSDFWPRSLEGRILCFLLALYAFAIWGYVTASLATFFLGRDADRDDAEIAGQKGLDRLRSDIASLAAEVRVLSDSVRKAQ